MFQEGDSPILKLALGRTKFAKTRYAMYPLELIIEELRKLPKDVSHARQLTALRKAAKIGQSALVSQVSKIGKVTGNLLASVSKRDVKYSNNKGNYPVSVVVVGFRRPTGSGSQSTAQSAFGGSVLKGPNRAFHSHLVEFGTKGIRTAGKSVSTKRRRVIMGGRIRTLRERQKQEPTGRGVLSSFNTRREFKGRGTYPIDFIATGSVAPMPALHPLETAFRISQGEMQDVIDRELRKALMSAARKMEKDAKKAQE